MSLVARVSLMGALGNEPEDYLFSALSVIFPDDTTNQHGDADHGVIYTSPNLPEPLNLSFSHFVWNSSLLLAKLVEAGTIEAAEKAVKAARGLSTAVPAAVARTAGLRGSGPQSAIPEEPVVTAYCSITDFDVAGKTSVEMGAGTALPSILAALLGTTRAAITDYPADIILSNLRDNLARNVKGPSEASATNNNVHRRRAGRRAYDRVFVCDCLWMPWTHDNLRKSIDWFLKEGDESRCWVVAGFHTRQPTVVSFFDEAALAACNLEIAAIWERGCDDRERDWSVDRGIEDPTERKRWLVVAILRRRRQPIAASG